MINGFGMYAMALLCHHAGWSIRLHRFEELALLGAASN
jgi:hypothetical protein